MASRSVQLRVGGQTYRVVSSAGEDELGRLAAAVDAKLATVVPPGRAITPQAMLLAAMSLAHDLEEERERGRALAEQARSVVGRIVERIEAVLGPEGAGHDAHHDAGSEAATAELWRSPGSEVREPAMAERRGTVDRRELSASADRRDPPTRPSSRS